MKTELTAPPPTPPRREGGKKHRTRLGVCRFSPSLRGGVGGGALLLPLLLTAQNPTDTLSPPLYWRGGRGVRPDTLPLVTVRDARFEQTGYTAWRADTLPIAAVIPLTDRLLWESPLAVRANGAGTLATVSARGAGPSRSPVFWNGINLQSPMNGVVDLSLLPVWPGDRVELRYGGQSAALSSGAMGGSVLVSSDAASTESGFSAQANLAAGSFGLWQTGCGAGFSGKKYAAQVRAAWQQADNDFPFQNTAQIGQPHVRQINNFGRKSDIQHFNRFIFNEKNVVRSAAWHQSAFRQLPPAMTEAAAETWQADRANRAVLTWENRPDSRSQWQTRVAALDEFLAFRNLGRTETSRSRTWLGTSEYARNAGRNLIWKLGANAVLQSAQVDGYSDSSRWFRQRRAGAFGMAEQRFRRGQLVALLRQEWLAGEAAPFTWSLGGRWDLGRQTAGNGHQAAASTTHSLSFHLSRNFNLPTLNDRYWANLGKPDLRPESGYSGDLSWAWQQDAFSTELVVFQLLIDDWILWQPGADGLFRPDNLRQVWSRGAEWRTAWHTRTASGWLWKLSSRYQFVRATNVAVYGGNTEVLRRDLPYTPRHTGGLTLTTSRGGFSGAYLHQFTGPRFVTSDNATVLKGFSTGNLLVQYGFFPRKRAASRSQQHIGLSFRLENVWDSPYQVIAYRPMPGRAWSFGVSVRG